MKVDIKSIEDIKDSRIVYEKNPPSFGYFFIAIITFLLAVTIVWSVKTNKVYEVVARGVVTNEDISYVVCNCAGEVEACNMKEGMFVNKGDELLAIKSMDLFAESDKKVIKATESGVLHMRSDIKQGMIVQSSMVMATISPKNVGDIIDAYVSTADRAKIHEGDEVVISVDGLLQNVYGNIKGKVKKIDSDVTVSEGQNQTQQSFRIKISMDVNNLVGTSGDKVDIVNGMTVTSRITYDKVTYFDYVLDKLGIKIKRTNIRSSSFNNEIMIIGGSIVILGGLFLVIIKKRYWFW